ncbi:YybS family protein [Virgibacillus sp. C22-A2]|uniref:YybS family protein n=1 Tax=Virgibacillus tibetensis TaxID=3042313 RepID=A0ABU6KIY9_9BACI|nr:YybS family protein [Virgibacillus sp. C22-A2]
MNQSKQLTDGALLTAIYIVLLLVTVFVPVVSILTTFLLPIPFIIFAFKHDWKPSLLMLAVAAVLTMLFATVFSFPLVVLVGLGGLMIGSAMHQNLSAYETWARGTFGFIVGLLFVFVFTQFMLQINLIEEFQKMIDQSLEMTTGIFERFGAAEQTDEALEMMQTTMGGLTELIPVGLAMAAIMLAFISQWISYKVINRIESKQLYFPPFRTLQFPIAIVWVYFFALIFSFIEFDANSIFNMGAQNILVLTGLLMTIQGFSFIFFYAHHKKMSKAIPIVIVILTLLFPLLLIYLVRIVGIIDLGFGLRERLTKKKE